MLPANLLAKAQGITGKVGSKGGLLEGIAGKLNPIAMISEMVLGKILGGGAADQAKARRRALVEELSGLGLPTKGPGGEELDITDAGEIGYFRTVTDSAPNVLAAGLTKLPRGFGSAQRDEYVNRTGKPVLVAAGPGQARQLAPGEKIGVWGPSTAMAGQLVGGAGAPVSLIRSVWVPWPDLGLQPQVLQDAVYPPDPPVPEYHYAQPARAAFAATAQAALPAASTGFPWWMLLGLLFFL